MMYIYRASWIAVLLVLSTAVLFACASTHVPSLTSDQASLEQEEDEQEMWAISERLEHYLERKEVIYKDPKLTSYLKAVMGSVLKLDII
ncbi:MAG: hypothetical protein U1F76_11655 [Candidatus Competibacteraceae bacterium]